MLDLLKDTQIFLSLWFNVVPGLEKLCQAVGARNDQANLKPTLNKRIGEAGLTIICDWLSPKSKKLWKDPERVF